MKYLARFVIGFATFAAMPFPASASPGWEAKDAELLAEITPKCSGGVYDNALRSAQEIALSLPKPGEVASSLNDRRANDTYKYAGALLKPEIVNPERALDPSSFVRCPPNAALGVKLMTYLAGQGPADAVGVTNVFYWLGMAYRRGIGVTADAVRARRYFLQARALGLRNLTVEDWGERPTDRLVDLLKRSENRRWLEEAAARGKQGAIVSLADVMVDEQPMKARAMLASIPDNFIAARTLAEGEMAGRFGEAHPENAVAALAHFRRLVGPYYELMLKAAKQYNDLGDDIPNAPTPATLEELGGSDLLKDANKTELDSVRGEVKARALVDPEGRIIYTEVPDPHVRRFKMASATLDVFVPSKLKAVRPLVLGGKPKFHWRDLPPINWRAPAGTLSLDPKFLP